MPEIGEGPSSLRRPCKCEWARPTSTTEPILATPFAAPREPTRRPSALHASGPGGGSSHGPRG
eukprot:3249473-Alexandrium_andersonii.AAC.1